MPRKKKVEVTEPMPESAASADNGAVQPCNCNCHKSVRKKPLKPPSAAQLAARKKFKARVVEAKKIRAEHPDWSMPKCMQAVGK